jgi:aspartate aminotransferase-like enzyme
MKLSSLIKSANKKKIFTPGPGSLSYENIIGLKPSFGRNDVDYDKTLKYVENFIKKLSGQPKVISLQGSGSLALEIMCINFLYGKVLLVETGYYSDRIKFILQNIKDNKIIKKIDFIGWESLKQIKKSYDWVIACYVETSKGLKIPIKELYDLKLRSKAKLMLDATASIGLEESHGFSDVLCFSSCKGLFGLTGASFVAYKTQPRNNSKFFYLNINVHDKRMVTGPYHTICSLYNVFKQFNKFKKSVINNKKFLMKKMKSYLMYKNKNQPNLCTYINKKISKIDKNVILYEPRAKINGTILCHLGELHLKNKAKGNIFHYLKFDE